MYAPNAGWLAIVQSIQLLRGVLLAVVFVDTVAKYHSKQEIASRVGLMLFGATLDVALGFDLVVFHATKTHPQHFTLGLLILGALTHLVFTARYIWIECKAGPQWWRKPSSISNGAVSCAIFAEVIRQGHPHWQPASIAVPVCEVIAVVSFIIAVIASKKSK